MKKNLWMILVTAISTSLLAQDTSNSPPPVVQAPPATPPPIAAPPPAAEPAPAIEASTNAPTAPTAKTKKKKSTKKVAAHKPMKELKTVPLVPGPAVVEANHVNVRSKAGLVGEIVTRMTNGEPVTVIEEVNLKHSGVEEPSAWAKIQLPADAHVWLKSSYLDTNNAVTASKLKLRAGPGENYAMIGILQKGDAVQPINTKGDWTQIQAPTNGYAYIAAQYLTQAPEALAAATPTTSTTVAEGTNMAPASTEVAPDTNQPPASDTNQLAMAEATTNPAPMVEETNQPPPPPRIVQREGIVRGTFSIQAPTHFELVNPEDHRTMDYLFATNSEVDLNRYKGMHIIVTGEEGLDERWKNTPVITIQDIKVLE